MKNILLVVDTKNLLNSLLRNYNVGKLDYIAYRQLVTGQDHIYNSIAYGQQSQNPNFMIMLGKLGFVCKFKPEIVTANRSFNHNHNVQLTIDVCNQLASNKIDTVVIGSSDPELADLVSYIRELGFHCSIIACRIPNVLKNACNDWTELTESTLLKEPMLLQNKESILLRNKEPHAQNN